jgi:hypothetical protein
MSLAVAIVCAACSGASSSDTATNSSMQTTATPSPTVTPISPATTRNVQIVSDVSQQTDIPSAEVFTIELIGDRDSEGVSIGTYHRHFWELGNTSGELVEGLGIQIVVDGVLQTSEPFVFWRNGSVQEVYDNDGNVLGSYLWSPMTINFSTQEVPVGEHSLTILVTNLSGVVFEKSWDILISPKIRESMSVELVPSAQYLQQNPESIPEFIQYVDFSTRYIDRFSYHEFPSREGVCVYPEREVMSSIIGSRSYNEVIQMSIDNEILSEDQVSIVLDERTSICVETNYLENGLHLATFTLLIDPPQSYTWVFSAES